MGDHGPFPSGLQLHQVKALVHKSSCAVIRTSAAVDQRPPKVRVQHEKQSLYKKVHLLHHDTNLKFLFFPILSRPLERRMMNQIEQIPRTRVDSALGGHPLQIHLHSRGPRTPTGWPSLPCACE